MSSLLNQKLKINFKISQIETFNEMKAYITLQEHFLLFKPLVDKNNIKIIQNLMRPIYYQENEDTFYINFSFIKSLNLDKNCNCVNLKIFNPLNPDNINIIFTKIELIGLVFNKVLKNENLDNFFKFIQVQIKNETKIIIEQLLYFFNILKEDFHSHYINEIRIFKCISISKKYYEKSIAELKKQNKLKNSIKKKICENEDIITKNKNTTSNNTTYSNNKLQNIIETFIPENINNNIYSNFDYILSEIKFKSIYLIEESTLLFFQVSNQEMNLINLRKVKKEKVTKGLKNLNEKDKNKKLSTLNRSFNIENKINDKNVLLNKSANINQDHILEDIGRQLVTNSTKTDSNKYSEKIKLDHSYSNKEINNLHLTIDTPKFGKNEKENFTIKNNINLEENLSYTQILKKIEIEKKSHLFLPTNSYLNICNNSIEIIHRKFFDFCIEEHFHKIFQLEKDNLGIIKLECIYNTFLYIRMLKNLLFTDQNKLYFSNVFFEED